MAKAPAAPPGQLQVVPLRHWGRFVAAAVVLLVIAMLVHTLFFSRVTRPGGRMQPRFQWGIIGHYFFSSSVLDGLAITVLLTIVAMAGGIAIGMLVAVMRLSPNPVVTSSAWSYIWFFRGTPVLVQLLFWYNLNYIFPTLSVGVPFGPALFHINMKTGLTSFVAAAIGLVLNEGAYMSEIVRAGIVSVDEGQTEAAQSVGMSRLATLRLVVLPQAMRVILPPTGNETISMLKTTSLASVITVGELTYNVEQIYSANYLIVPLLLDACLWYLVVTSVMMIGQYYLERHFARGTVRQMPPTPLQRLRQGLLIRPGSARFGRAPWVVAGETVSVVDEGR